MTAISVPYDLWEEDLEGVVSTWFYDDGDTVSAGDVVAELLVEKVQYEVCAPCDGVLRIQVNADDTVNKGDVIGSLE